jgi:hypothetical protein
MDNTRSVFMKARSWFTVKGFAGIRALENVFIANYSSGMMIVVEKVARDDWH